MMYMYMHTTVRMQATVCVVHTARHHIPTMLNIRLVLCVGTSTSSIPLYCAGRATNTYIHTLRACSSALYGMVALYTYIDAAIIVRQPYRPVGYTSV